MKNTEIRTVEKIVRRVNKFYSSIESMIFFIAITLVFSALQITMFLTGFQLNGFTKDDGNQALAWAAIIISMLSCLTGMIGGVFVARGSLLAMPFSLFQVSAQSVSAIFSGMWMSASSLLIGLVVIIVRQYIWKNKIIEKSNLTEKNKGYIALGVILSLLSIYLIAESLIPADNITHKFAGSDSLKPKWTWYFDAVGAGVNLAGTILLIFKTRWAYFAFLLGKSFILASYIFAQAIIPIVQNILFLIMDVTGFISWSLHMFSEPTEEK